VHLDPLGLPDDWTPEQAFAVAEFLIALHDAIWDGYGWAVRDERSGPPSPWLAQPRGDPGPVQLALPLTNPGDAIP
jgi:hypothetical protein